MARANAAADAQWGETFVPALVRREKDIEQNHLCFAFPGIPMGHDDN